MLSLDEKYELRELYEKCRKLCDLIEEAGLWKYSGRMRMSKTLTVELVNMCQYFAASDGMLSQPEIVFFHTVLGIDFTAEEIIRFTKEHHIYSVEFEETVPLVIRGAVAAKGKVAKTSDTDVPIPEFFYILFSEIGKAFIKSDGIHENEVKDYKIYMGTIQDFIREAEMDS